MTTATAANGFRTATEIAGRRRSIVIAIIAAVSPMETPFIVIPNYD